MSLLTQSDLSQESRPPSPNESNRLMLLMLLQNTNSVSASHAKVFLFFFPLLIYVQIDLKEKDSALCLASNCLQWVASVPVCSTSLLIHDIPIRFFPTVFCLVRGPIYQPDDCRQSRLHGTAPPPSSVFIFLPRFMCFKNISDTLAHGWGA